MTTNADNTPGVPRREFVKATAAISAGALAGPAFAWAGAGDTLKIGLVGCGGRGTGAAENAIKADRGVVLWAMADMFPDRLEGSLKHLSGRHGERVDVAEDRKFTGFDAYQQLIDSDVDVVLLATPPHFRPMHLDAAVKANKHVFCEKPMAVDASGVRSVLASAAEAKSRDLSLVSGFCWRYSLADRATFKKVHDGAIGELGTVYTTYNTGPLRTKPRQDGWTDMEWQLRNWQHFTWLSGDHIVEQACHSIDKMAWAFNGMLPVRATAVGGRMARTGLERGDSYDHFAVTYEFENGARGFHMCRQIAGCSNDNTDYMIGSKGTCFVNGWDKLNGHRINGETEWRFEGREESVGQMYQNEHDELFASIRSGRPINDGEWMANSTMLALIGRMAAYTGQTITWKDAMASELVLAPPAYEMGPLAMPEVPVPGQTKFV